MTIEVSTDVRKLLGISLVSVVPGALLATVHLLYVQDIDVYYKGYNKKTALCLIVQSGHIDYVNLMLEASRDHHQAEIDAMESVRGWMPLIIAYVKEIYHQWSSSFGLQQFRSR